MTTRSTTRRHRLGAVVLGAGLALAAFGFVSPGASAQDPPDNPTFVDGANPKCADVEVGSFPSEFKIDQQPPDGDSTWDTTDAVGEVPASLVIEISNLVQGGGTVTFDWSATVGDGNDAGTERDPFLIDGVLVKASTGANLYSYVPPASSDTGLISPMSSISHISFCFGPHDDTTTSTPTSEPSTSETQTTETQTTETPTTPTSGPDVLGTDAKPAATVAGVTVAAAALPATGANDYSLMIIGAGLALAGGMSLMLSNRAATAVAQRYEPKHRHQPKHRR